MTIVRPENLFQLLDICNAIGQQVATDYTEGDDRRIRIDARGSDVLHIYADDQLIKSLGLALIKQPKESTS